MSAGGGGAWKVAYADFVTAMMAFFMVMWLTTQKEGVKEAVAGYFRDPFATFKSNEKGAAATAAPITNPMYGHTAQPQKRPIAISGDSTDYQFTVIFPNDDATIESSQLEYIKGFSPMMVGKLNRVEVRGHCVRRPLPEGSAFIDHWQLCYARCQAVKKELEAFGIEPARIRLSQAEGNEPLALNLSKDELQLNSRVDVILLPDLAEIAWQRPEAPKDEPIEAEPHEGVNAGLTVMPEAPAAHGEHTEHGAKESHAAEGTEPSPHGSEHAKTSTPEHDAEHSEPAHAAEHGEPAHAEGAHETPSVEQAVDPAAAEMLHDAPAH